MGMGLCPSTKLRLLFFICFLTIITLLLLLIVASVFFYYPFHESVTSDHSNTPGIQNPFAKILPAGDPPPAPVVATVPDLSPTTHIPLPLVQESVLVPTFDGGVPVAKFRHSRITVEEREVESSQVSNRVENRFMHLDFKGAPPKIPFIKETVLLAKQAGITGVLIEWEDSFPWTGLLANTTMMAGHFYTDTDVRAVVDFIEEQGLDVIPLIQTFGHAEYILKLEQFSTLRELDEDPQSFCPSRSGTIEIIQEMISQIVAAHPNSRFVHIGCDEVFNLRLCTSCTSNSDSKEELFLRHVSIVAKMVRLSGKVPIIWDDMLRSISYDDLLTSNIGTLVEIMIWVYASDVDRYVGYDSWEKYSRIFPTIWVAGAFKGASGERALIPVTDQHVANALEWLNIIGRESQNWRYGLGGMVLTGWSRYDHFAVLCELLPAAVPSLVYVSMVISSPVLSHSSIRNRIFSDSSRQRRSSSPMVPHPRQSFRGLQPTRNLNDTEIHGKNETLWGNFSKILSCTALPRQPDFATVSSKCTWTGSSFLRSLPHHRDLIAETTDLLGTIRYKRGWLTDYHLRHNFTSPHRVSDLISYDISRLKRNLAQKAKSLAISLRPIYSSEVILEWIEQNVWFYWRELKTLEEIGESLKNFNVWPRRPIKSSLEIVTDLGLQSQLNKTEL